MLFVENRIVFLSGGKASFAVADYVKRKYPHDNILLYFQDVLVEHHDTYRFLEEASDKLKLPLLTHSMGLTPIQLMFERKMLYNSRIADCSKILKVRTAKNFLKRGMKPTIEKWRNKHFLKRIDFRTKPILYLGIGFDEMHRSGPVKENWKPFRVEFPLIDYVIDTDLTLKKYGIRQPDLYNLGFSHNNCNGCCVRAGVGHFKNLKRKMPEVYNKFAEQEHYLKLYISEYHRINRIKIGELQNFFEDTREHWLKQLDNCYRDYFYGRAKRPKVYIPMDLHIDQYTFLKRTRKNETKPLSLSALSREIASDKGEKINPQLSLFDNEDLDIGGCGCFTDVDNSEDEMTCNLPFQKREQPKTITIKPSANRDDTSKQLALF